MQVSQRNRLQWMQGKIEVEGADCWYYEDTTHEVHVMYTKRITDNAPAVPSTDDARRQYADMISQRMDSTFCDEGKPHDVICNTRFTFPQFL